MLRILGPAGQSFLFVLLMVRLSFMGLIDVLSELEMDIDRSDEREDWP